MKAFVNMARVVVGLLFIFSGLVKAIDPRGLAYKMEEFFEVWAAGGFMKGFMMQLHSNALAFSVFMITLEIMLGIALLLAWKKKLTSWLLFLLTLFFTFLTAFVLFSGKIKECGCFGNCIPLTPVQTFTKDIILLVLVLFLLLYQKYLQPILKPLATAIIVWGGTLIALVFQLYVLKHLPPVDCLPYKEGANMKEQMQMPKDAVFDKFDYQFIYEKDGQRKEYPMTALPDSTWKFIDRKEVLIEKGKNNIPPISGFTLSTQDGRDITDSILAISGKYYLLFIKELPGNTEKWIEPLKAFAGKPGVADKLFIVTSQPVPVQKYFKENGLNNAVLTCDGTAIKTAARANPVIFIMNGPVIQKKVSWADFDALTP